jgi:hypothetical protein
MPPFTTPVIEVPSLNISTMGGVQRPPESLEIAALPSYPSGINSDVFVACFDVSQDFRLFFTFHYNAQRRVSFPSSDRVASQCFHMQCMNYIFLGANIFSCRASLSGVDGLSHGYVIPYEMLI